jgi:hypothetical protein
LTKALSSQSSQGIMASIKFARKINVLQREQNASKQNLFEKKMKRKETNK